MLEDSLVALEGPIAECIGFEERPLRGEFHCRDYDNQTQIV